MIFNDKFKNFSDPTMTKSKKLKSIVPPTCTKIHENRQKFAADAVEDLGGINVVDEGGGTASYH